jgi:hypothetical protein
VGYQPGGAVDEGYGTGRAISLCMGIAKSGCVACSLYIRAHRRASTDEARGALEEQLVQHLGAADGDEWHRHVRLRKRRYLEKRLALCSGRCEAGYAKRRRVFGEVPVQVRIKVQPRERLLSIAMVGRVQGNESAVMATVRGCGFCFNAARRSVFESGGTGFTLRGCCGCFISLQESVLSWRGDVDCPCVRVEF